MASVFFKLVRDDISPKLSRMARTARQPKPILLAMGNAFKSITVGNFNSAGLQYRPTPWPAKMDGTAATLKKTGHLWSSFNLEVTDQFARLSNPTPYAAIHQFGGTIEPVNADALVFKGPDGKPIFAKKVTMPPRPFYPVLNGKLTAPAEKLIAAAGEKAARKQFDGK